MRGGRSASRTWGAIAAFFLGLSSVVAQPCGNGTLDVSLRAGAIANRFAVLTHGQPFSAAWLGMDRASGRFPTPAGDLCLGLTPAFQVFPLFLDGSGVGRIEGTLPPDLGLVGLTFHFQAAALDPMAPGGIALSPLRTKVIHRPRVFVLDTPRGSSPFQTSPLQLLAYDGLDTSLSWTRSAPTLRFLRSAPGSEVVCISEADTTIFGLNAADGAVRWSDDTTALDLCLAEDHRELLVLTTTSVRRLDLRDGTALGDVPHGLTAVTLPEVNRVVLRTVPGTNTVLVRSRTTVQAVDLDGIAPPRMLFQATSPQIIERWAVGAGIVGVLVRNATSAPGAAGVDLFMVDTFTGQPMPGSPVRVQTTAISPGNSALGFGPTPSGFGFLVSTSGGELVEVRLDGQVGARRTVNGTTTYLVPTEGGVGWIRPSVPGTSLSVIQLDIIDGPTLNVTTVGQVPGNVISYVSTRRSGLFPAGFLGTGRQVFAFPTDPPGGFGLFATPPIVPSPFTTTSDLLITDG